MSIWLPESGVRRLPADARQRRRPLPVDAQRPAHQQGLPEEAHQPGAHLHPEQEGRQDGEGFHERQGFSLRVPEQERVWVLQQC